MTMLPSGTDGTAGTSATYALFGDFPQTIKASAVTVDETKTFTMGGQTYYKGSDGNWYAEVSSDYYKVEPIKWRVVTTDYSGKKLLVAENILMGACFDTNGGNTYSSSSIQTYLTGSFLSSAFTSGSQNLISTTTVEGASGKIFLLSKTDAENSSYFSGDSSRIRNHTDFAVANGAENNAQNNGAGWWCRPGSVHRIALSVCKFLDFLNWKSGAFSNYLWGYSFCK